MELSPAYVLACYAGHLLYDYIGRRMIALRWLYRAATYCITRGRRHKRRRCRRPTHGGEEATTVERELAPRAPRFIFQRI